uniref:Uncharacterized protein n=1 Tax=Arundo donax TaxID=35708 RepID=A0A0A9GU20_ARUDO
MHQRSPAPTLAHARARQHVGGRFWGPRSPMCRPKKPTAVWTSDGGRAKFWHCIGNHPNAHQIRVGIRGLANFWRAGVGSHPNTHYNPLGTPLHTFRPSFCIPEQSAPWGRGGRRRCRQG